MRPIWPNRIIFILALAGIAVSGYLTLAHLQAVDLGCSRLRGCEDVARHWSAKGLGIPGLQAIPTAAFGALAYAALFVLAFLRAATDSEVKDRRFAGMQWALSAIALGVTVWLTYMEAFVIKAWCQWCLASAFITLLIFLCATVERLLGAASPAPRIETQGEPV